MLVFNYRPRRTRTILVFCAFLACIAILLTVSPRVFSQQPALPPEEEVQIVPEKIEYIPPLAKAVLARDLKQAGQLLEQGESINERVRAIKDARAGFTPLILAASISAPEMTEFLVRRGAKITDLDDYHRSAFWYAALNQSVLVTQTLMANGALEVINEADVDFKRTPLHLAVRGTSPEIVWLLYKLGASWDDQRDVLGETPREFCTRRATEACKDWR